MAKPLCSSNEPWDREGSIDELFKIRKDKTNGDVVIWEIFGDDVCTETRLSSRAAINFGLTLVEAASGVPMSGLYKLLTIE